MNNDLISRSALKESIRKRLCISSLDYLTEQEKVIVDEIDNAQPVEPPAWQIEFLRRLYEKVCPQGKWGKWVISEIRCPSCLEYFQTDCYSTEELNECPNCGAKMRAKGGSQ